MDSIPAGNLDPHALTFQHFNTHTSTLSYAHTDGPSTDHQPNIGLR
jgi:hypothetical protein